jgi:hypothetical protein
MVGSSLRWTGFADLVFAESAHLAFARAVEQAATDVHEHRPESWVIEDRRIAYAEDVDDSTADPRARSVVASPQALEGTKRLLAALALQAIAGEAAIEVAMPPERWVVRAAAPSISKELVVGDDVGEGETIRTTAS